MKRIGIAVLLILFMASAVYAVDEKAIKERITKLEEQKAQIEAAYVGLIARIEELKALLNENAGKSQADSQDKKEKK